MVFFPAVASQRLFLSIVMSQYYKILRYFSILHLGICECQKHSLILTLSWLKRFLKCRFESILNVCYIISAIFNQCHTMGPQVCRGGLRKSLKEARKNRGIKKSLKSMIDIFKSNTMIKTSAIEL